MHYTVKYKGKNAEKRSHALVDCRDWLGNAKYLEAQRNFQEYLKASPTRKAIREITFALAFAGIQGYPARQFALNCAKRNGDGK